MKGARNTLFALLILHAAYGHAAIYMCKDASGRTLTSDMPIPECSERPLREYGNKGYLKRTVPAPLTAEEKQERAAEQARKKSELEAAEEVRRSDQALVARYRSEEEIAAARQRDLDLVGEHIDMQKKIIANAQSELKATQAEVAQGQGGAVVPGLQYKLDQSRKSALQMEMRLRDSEKEVANINAKYDATLQRFREISQAAPTQ